MRTAVADEPDEPAHDCVWLPLGNRPLAGQLVATTMASGGRTTVYLDPNRTTTIPLSTTPMASGALPTTLNPQESR